jgi:hypothetical protein
VFNINVLNTVTITGFSVNLEEALGTFEAYYRR